MIRLSVVERVYLSALAVLLAVCIVLGCRLMRRMAHFQAQKLREAERDTLIRDVEMWLEAQRERGA